MKEREEKKREEKERRLQGVVRDLVFEIFEVADRL